jgi:hypothetical protein
MRRPPAAVQGILVCVLALGLASLLNAQGLRKTAEIQPESRERSVAIAVTTRLVTVSHALYLDRPRHELRAAVGRADDDRIDTAIVLPTVAVPPARDPVVTHRAFRPPVPSVRPRRARPRPRRVVTAARPLRIWVVGDSLGDVPGAALERAAAANPALDVLGVETRVATGLSRPDVYNWYARVAEAVREQRPDVAVLSFGSNDGHHYMSGVPDRVSLGNLGSRSWVAEYRRRVDGLTRMLIASRITVVWIGLPIPRGPNQHRNFAVINRVIRSVARSRARETVYVDTWRMFSDARGRYAEYLRDADGRLVRMRSSDGVHFETPAGELVARAVLRELARRYDFTSRRKA